MILRWGRDALDNVPLSLNDISSKYLASRGEVCREYPEIDPALEGFEVSIWQRKTGGATETTVNCLPVVGNVEICDCG